MTFVSSILSRMHWLSKPRLKFLQDLFGALSRFRGRATMLNLSRYGAGSPCRIRRWWKKSMDWCRLHEESLQQQGVCEHRLAVAIDATFLPKSGKQTEELGYFYNGCHSRAEKGLEACCLALVDLEESTAYAIDIEQSCASLSEDEEPPSWRCLRQMLQLNAQLERLERLGVKHLLADGEYATKYWFGFIQGCQLELVTKLRCDANLRYLYQGPRTSGPGRPREFDGKVDFQDWSKWQRLECEQEEVHIYSALVNSEHFATDLRVVVLQKQRNGKTSRRILASTDLGLSARELIELYASRFQIEFLFRDAKQYTGLHHGQMLDKTKRNQHLQASMAATNMMRLEHRFEHLQRIENHELDQSHIHAKRVISIDDLKRRKYNEHLLLMNFEQLGFDPELTLIHPVFQNLRNYGLIAA